MDLRLRIGLNLQNLRRARQLSQEELAARADVNQSYLSDIERGVRNPSVMVLDRIAKALSIDPEEFFRPRARNSDRGHK